MYNNVNFKKWIIASVILFVSVVILYFIVIVTGIFTGAETLYQYSFGEFHENERTDESSMHNHMFDLAIPFDLNNKTDNDRNHRFSLDFNNNDSDHNCN